MTDSESANGVPVPAPGQPEPRQRELLETRCERLTRALLDAGLVLPLGRALADASSVEGEAS
jgi:hypothetical protein